MTEIAIVEANDADAERLRSVLTEFSSLHGIDFSVTRYPTAEEFLSERKNFRVVFLDPDFAAGGMEAARQLRGRNAETAIVFVTRNLLQAAKSYEVDALDYIIKPVTLERLSMRLPRAFCTEAPAKTVMIKDRMGPVQIAVESIHYVEIHGHALLWHTEQGTFSSCGTMKGVAEMLAPYGFSLCNSCYLVNLRRVYRVKGYTLTMASGDVLKISQPRKKGFIAALRRG